MTSDQRSAHPPAPAIRRFVRVGLWLVAAGAATTLGLDLEGDGRH